MATTFLAPDPIQGTFFIPGTNTPGNGVQVFFYSNKTTTKQTAYKDPLGATPWTNPIVLDSGGNLPSGAEVWFQEGLTYTVVYAPSNDTDPPTSPYRTLDNLVGMNDPSASGGTTEWVAAAAPTFVSASQFSMVGDQTAVGNAEANKRMKFSVTGPPTTAYGVIQSAGFSAGSTQVVMNMTVGALDSGVSAGFYSILGGTNPSVPIFGGDAKASSVAVTTSATIWDNGGNWIHMRGTSTIQNFGTAPFPGATAKLIFDSAGTIIQQGANISTYTGNILTRAGDRAIVVADTLSLATIAFYQSQPAQLLESQCQLRFINTAFIALFPRDGNLINIPGQHPLTIASSGVFVGPGPGASATINGSVSTLNSSTTYDVYAFRQSDNTTGLDFSPVSTGNHSTDATTGIEIKGGDATRAYVGKIFTSPTSTFVFTQSSVTNGTSGAQIGVISWFNRKPITALTQYAIANSIITNTETESTQQPRIAFLTFGEDSIPVSVSGVVSATSASQNITAAIALDVTSTPFSPVQTVTINHANVSYPAPGVAGALIKPSEGLHFLTWIVGCTGAAATGTIGVSSCIMATLRG